MALFHSPSAIGFLSRFGFSSVVERELRVAARKPGTYWSRVGAALIAILLLGVWFAGPLTIALTRQAGRTSFRVLALLAALMVTTSVLALAAESFAREKREGTLGLLFLTPLKPWDLVLGKLVSTSLGPFYRFVAVVPVLALPIIGGGITFREFLLLVVVLSNLAFFVAALGLYVSANSWDEKRAGMAASLTFLGLALLLPALAAWFVVLNGGGQAAMIFLFASPAYPVWQATVTGLGRQPTAFWCSLLLTHVGGWLFLLATWDLLPRCWQSKPPQQATPYSSHGLPDQTFPPEVHAGDRELAQGKVRGRLKPAGGVALLDQDPVLWFALRWRADAASAWILAAGAFIILSGAFLTDHFEAYLRPEFALYVCFFANAALKTYVCEQAALALARDRAEDALELLVATPLTAKELVNGYLKAARQTMGKLVRRALMIEASWLGLTLMAKTHWTAEEIELSLAVGLAMLALLIPDLYAVGWAGLWAGAVAKDSRTGATNALLKVLCVPWLLVLGTLPFCWLFGRPPSPWLALCGVIIGSIVMDWSVIRGAKRRLLLELPNLAQRRAAGEVEFFSGWERLGRWLGRLWSGIFR